MFLLIAHVDLEPGAGPEDGLAAAMEPVELLAAQPDTRRLRWARSTEARDRLVLVAEYDSAAACRRAMSPFEVRSAVIPWLSAAGGGTSGVYEVLAAADGGALRQLDVTVPDPGR